MTNLRGIGFENFRVFEKPEWFDFSPITILTGPNSSGKSSISKALNLFKHNSKLSQIDFDTPDHQLGSFDLFKNTKSKNDKVSFYFPAELGSSFEALQIKLEYFAETGTQLAVLNKFELFDSINGNIYFSSESFYENDNSYGVRTFVDFGFFKDLFHAIIKYERERNDENIYNLLFGDFINKTANESYFNNSKGLIKLNPTDTYFRWFCLMSEKEIKNYYNREIRRAEKRLQQFKIGVESEENRQKKYNEYLDSLTLFKVIPDKQESIEDYIIGVIEDGQNKIKKHQVELEKNLNLKKQLLSELGEPRLRELIKEIESNTLKYRIQEDSNYDIFCSRPLDLWEESLINSKTEWIPREMHIIIESHIPSNFIFIKNGRRYGANMLNPDIFNELGNCIERNSRRFKESLPHFINDTINYLIRNIRDKEKSINYIEAVRNNSQRLYSYNNTAGSFNALLKKFQAIDLYHFQPYINTELSNLEIADGIEIEKLKEGIGNIVYLLSDNKKINLSDLGFGTIQLLPILMQVCIVANKNSVSAFDGEATISHFRFERSTIIIEEPESNLHPKLQSKLAELFVTASKKFNIQFIIETHSEYLIRKLQYLTAKKEIKPKDVVIYYLNSPKTIKETGVDQKVKIEIKADGSLTNDFGPGFFDEAIRLQLELMHMHNQN